jgi:ABC-type transport system involved in multi-copper enzyme maturation permease subunit
MDSASALDPVRARGWRSGLGNLFSRESHVWWGTRFGLWQVAIWLVVINGLMAIIISEATDGPGGGEDALYSTLEPFFGIAAWFTIVGTIIIAQGAIVGEKRSGTAEWILSGPVSRSAFLMGKMIPIGLGALVMMIALPGLVAYLEFTFLPATSGSALPAAQFVAALGITALQLAFYLALTVMLGTLFASRGPVIGIAMVVFHCGLFLPDVLYDALDSDVLTNLTPWPLTDTATDIARGDPVSSIVPIIATAVWLAVLIAIAIWRFKREEF